MNDSQVPADLPLRHAVATLAYRAAKAIRDTPDGFSEFRMAADSRSAGEILAHICDLMAWALSQAQGQERWKDSKPRAWEAATARFFETIKALDDYLASGAGLKTTPERIFQGAIADALTHTGQIALLRRLAGARVRGENYSRAKIEAGRTGADQPAPVAEFGK